MELTDNIIIEQTLNGEIEAFNTLVRRWERQIYALAFRVLKQDEEAYDICQETFMSAYRNLSKFRKEAKFSSWLYRIAINCCHTRLRNRGNNEISLEQQLEEYGFEPTTATEHLNNSLHREEIAGMVKQALDGLPPEMRQVIIMKEYQGLKFHEIAIALNIPVSTVKTRVYSGLEQLKHRLNYLQNML
ncbi:MAG: sigma-70 family RNA polymerase sigma factor [Acidobacteria bacterium]|nr:sigma-70 family RNA polymerase sigma factor [Acidobacteriota bacterium]